MKPRSNQIRIEWTFLAAVFVFCAILTALQYRWTGDLARAEMTRRRAHLAEPATQMARAFDAELSASTEALVPTATEMEASGREAAHVARYRRWLSMKRRPIFRCVAIAVRDGNALVLRSLDREVGKAIPMDWPAEWAEVESDLIRRISNPGGPRFTSRDGWLLEVPAFGGRRPAMGPNVGWLVLEIDAAYVREVWLPELAHAHFEADGEGLNEIRVRTEAEPATVIYTSARAGEKVGEPQVRVAFNRLGRRADEESGRWVLEVRQPPDTLGALVAASRRRNLAIALVLNALMLAAGVLLLRYTRRSRQFAEAQLSFVANVSHELRTPLTVIRGAAHNLQRGVVRAPERVAEYAELIVHHTEQLTGMVEQTIEYAGARKRMRRGAVQPVALAEVMRDAVAETEADTHAANCQVELSIPPALPAMTGDANALRRVFQNLIVNAAKHGGAGGWIGVTATATNEHSPPAIEVRVADRGPGIPERELSEIFQPFVRGTAAEARQVRGSGLGLSLVCEIVEAHGGAISVRSESGKGATFTVRLPVEAPAP